MEQSEFSLDVRLVATGPAVTSPNSEDCTSDGCGESPGSAGITNC
jgi:FxLD family lantipeptide